MKICVLNYTGDRGNWGCQATSRNLLAFLRASLGGVPHLEIVTVPLPKGHPVDGLVAATHGRRIRSIYESLRPAVHDVRFLHALTSERFGDLLGEVENSDIVVFQGEGSIGPQVSLLNVQLFGLPFLAAHLWRKPVLAVNQTLYACSAADAQALARIFSRFTLVAVREARSYAFARGIGLDRVLLCPDMAFAAFPPFPGPFATVPNVPYFCIAGSAVIASRGMDATLEAVRRISVRHGLRPVFMFSRPEDGNIARTAEKSFADIQFDVVSSKNFGRFEHILPLLSHAALVLWRRYHTSVSALSEGTPVVLLPGNTFKTEGIGPMLGLELPVIATDDVTGIVNEAGRLLAGGEELRGRIRAAIRLARACHARFGDLIRQFVTEGVMPGTPECLRPTPITFAEAGPHDGLYIAKNRGPRTPLAILARWQLRRLRQGAHFRESLRASLARPEHGRSP